MWTVVFHEEFEAEFGELPRAVRVKMAAHAVLLEQRGPQLSRPYADTLKGSRYPNMKELRFKAEGGVWRVAYAFDPEKHAVLLVAGSKAGVGQGSFYKQLIRKADRRFASHLELMRRR
jgi:hypothetical protein